MYLALLLKLSKVVLGGILRYTSSSKNITALNDKNMDGKVVIITGLSGMGKVSAKEFAKRGAIVLVGDVDLKNGEISIEKIRNETGNKNVMLMKLDLSDMDSVAEFAKKVSLLYPKIKILLINAGITGIQNTNVVANSEFNIQETINYMGHFLLTNLLQKNLRAGGNPRVICMPSAMEMLSEVDIDDTNMEKSIIGFDLDHPCWNSKFCFSRFEKLLIKSVEDTGIIVYSWSPCLMRENIYSTHREYVMGAIEYMTGVDVFTPEEAASELIRQCASDISIKNDDGKIFNFKTNCTSQ